MAITRSLSNGNEVVDWTSEVNEMDNQFGLLNDSGLFTEQGTSQLSVLFDKNTQTNTLLPQVNRNGGAPVKGKDRQVDTISIALPYFLHQDYITPNDIQSQRQAGTPDSAETLANVIATKLTDMRTNADQTVEQMKVEAIKGISSDGYGNVIANMFDVFGLTQDVIDFDLGNAASDIDGHIANLKRTVAKNAKAGGKIGRIEVMVSPEFFDKLISHSKIREAYIHYANNGVQVLRDSLAVMETWGVVDTFSHRGVLFYAYDAEFNLNNGSTKRAVDADEGFSIVTGMKDLYRGYYGPANTLSGANQVQGNMFVTQFTDPKDRFHEMEIEMAPLFFLTKPQVSIKVKTTS